MTGSVTGTRVQLEKMAESLATRFLSDVVGLLKRNGVVLGVDLEAALLRESVIDLESQAIILPRYNLRIQVVGEESVTIKPWGG